jgi:PIN domain nuclease of toxin-antitoxin system
MRLLLDTQVMLWWLLNDPRLGPETRELMATSPCVVSVASIWEVSIKHRLGKLSVAPAAFRDQSPLVHQVPFDRLLIAQARVEGCIASKRLPANSIATTAQIQALPAAEAGP